MDLFYQPAHELIELIKSRQISIEELVQAQLGRIIQSEEKVQAYITIDQEGALAKARQLDKELLTKEKLGGLYGIPIAYKDNLVTEHLPTTCGSRILQDYRSPFDATTVSRLKKVGGITLGKTNLDEFAMGSSTENSAFHPTFNPWDLTRVPGGSSGGSAAAVAAGEAVIGIGSDTGGSIRQPAAFCGVVGLKPTYGLVSRYGLLAFASSLDQVGPITRDVWDAALVLNDLVGYDDYDGTTVQQEKIDYTQSLISDVKDIRIGIPREYYGPEIAQGMIKKIEQAIQKLVRLGAVATETSLPHTDLALSAYYVIAPAEASSNLARYDGVRYGKRVQKASSLEEMYQQTRGQGLGQEVKRRIMLGTYVLSQDAYEACYLKAQKIRTCICQDFAKIFENNDILITPTTPTTAFKAGANVKEPLEMYTSDLCTAPASLAGLPAISIPVGFDPDGLPIGLQIIGKHYSENILLQVAYTLEQELNLTEKRPGIFAGK